MKSLSAEQKKAISLFKRLANKELPASETSKIYKDWLEVSSKMSQNELGLVQHILKTPSYNEHRNTDSIKGPKV